MCLPSLQIPTFHLSPILKESLSFSQSHLDLLMPLVTIPAWAFTNHPSQSTYLCHSTLKSIRLTATILNVLKYSACTISFP